MQTTEIERNGISEAAWAYDRFRLMAIEACASSCNEELYGPRPSLSKPNSDWYGRSEPIKSSSVSRLLSQVALTLA